MTGNGSTPRSVLKTSSGIKLFAWPGQGIALLAVMEDTGDEEEDITRARYSIMDAAVAGRGVDLKNKTREERLRLIATELLDVVVVLNMEPLVYSQCVFVTEKKLKSNLEKGHE